jgi:L-threonylcarbamoyladenylate synthase
MLNEQIQKAAEVLKSGGVVGMPTETVYGLAADIKNPKGIDAIFQTKKRPFFDPLIVHIAHLVQIKTVVSEFSSLAQFLADKYWPGPLTMVLPKNKNLNSKITSGLETVGVRFPKHTMAQKLIHTLGSPLAAPSANLFGKTSPTSADHVRKEFGDKVFVLDGGVCEVGLESTVIGFDQHETIINIYRPGFITADDLRKTLKDFNRQVLVTYSESKVAPGQLEHHYMPAIPLVILRNKKIGELENELKTHLKLAQWNPKELIFNNDPVLAARELYQELRKISASGANLIYVTEKPEHVEGLWVAIWDRLKKAASYKEAT